ncbi:hypothetical protein G4B88_005803 [Cannabis sativa]|uniref:Uncharacterized protein n=1 Tax=Cannabis sativa TaxID=3483 RepID=A0A7J6GRP9_CANSA|nr:hypothetical protein G4B88_005803 [Cannabis sativa]
MLASKQVLTHQSPCVVHSHRGDVNLFSGETGLRENKVKGSRNLELMEAFNFDHNSIDWEDYIINTHIPGLIKYVII